MKAILLTLALSLTTILLKAQTTDTFVSDGISITVTVPVTSDAGNVIFGLHNETTFMKAPLIGLESEITDGKATVTFTNVTPGNYGIVVLHDKNKNKRMDFEENGMPLEPYGTSNNVMNYGPPQWNDAKFEVGNEPIDMEIRL